MESDVARKVREDLSAVLYSMGYNIVRVKMFPHMQNGTLQIMIEHVDAQPISVDDCAKASHTISAALDVSDMIKHQYTLEVSSPGINRPLVSMEDFVKYKGCNVKLLTSELVDGRKRFKGVISNANENLLVVCVDDINYTIPFELVVDAYLVFDKQKKVLRA